MKSKFIYVRNIEALSVASVVYVVMIPDSGKGRRHVEFLTKYSALHGDWFERWGEHVDYRIDYYQERVFWNAPGHILQFRSCVISSDKLISLIKGDGLVAFEQNLSMPRSFFSMMCQFFPSHKLTPGRKARRSTLLTPSRKNLSLRRGSEVTDAVVGFSIVTLLYVVQMILDAIERVVCF